MLGIHKFLEPLLIEEYSDDFELIVAKIKVANKEIRLITGYGPQEYWIAIFYSIKGGGVQSYNGK